MTVAKLIELLKAEDQERIVLVTGEGESEIPIRVVRRGRYLSEDTSSPHFTDFRDDSEPTSKREVLFGKKQPARLLL